MTGEVEVESLKCGARYLIRILLGGPFRDALEWEGTHFKMRIKISSGARSIETLLTRDSLEISGFN